MPKKNDILVAVASIALACWVTSGFLVDPNGRASLVNSGDQALFEWLLSFGAYAVTHGADPLFTHLLNVPDGVNLAVNTSITVYSVLFSPLTMWLGAPATFLIILTFNLAATAFAWYWLFSRHLNAGPLAAAIGGLFCGFAPAMISHANAHLNWTAQWLVPLIIAQVIRLYRGDRWLGDGAILGVLVAACFSIAAEALFFAALALGVFSIFWVLAKRPPIGNVLKGLAAAAAVAAVFLAYPLWLHFAGPQRYHGTGFDPRVHNEDLGAYAVWPERSLAGWLGLNTDLAPNPTEENSFFGVPLLILVIAAFVLLWKRTEVKGLALTAGLFTLLSLGPELRLFGWRTGVWLPEALLSKMPIFNAALPSRLALVIAPIFGLMLAWLLDSLTRSPSRSAASTPASSAAGTPGSSPSGSAVGTPGSSAAGTPANSPSRSTASTPGSSPSGSVSRPAAGSARWKRLWIPAFALALVPLVPLPILTRDREPVPHFISSGRWQSYVTEKGVIAPIPLPNDLVPDGQRWQAYALAHQGHLFRVPSGFFLGPGGPNGTGRIGPIPRPTAELLESVAKTGEIPTITDADRAQARADLAYWNAEIVVLADTVSGAHWDPNQPALLKVTTDLLGPPTRVDDVWLWHVTPS